MDHYDKIVEILDRPYFKNLESMGIDKEHYNEIFKRIFNETVTISNRDIYNENGKTLYYESYQGEWLRREYNDNGIIIFYVNSFGEWYKNEYDEDGNIIYYQGNLFPFEG